MRIPIALFVYCRLEHTRRTVESLIGNTGACNHDLIIFSDAARNKEHQMSVDQVRAFLATIRGFRSVTIHHREHNFGLAKSIIDGVTQVLFDHECVIVLEDDMETSPHFLKYMSEALDKYADDDRVISIHGYVYPVKEALPEAFFLRGADCWGWATWKRGWALFNPNGQTLMDELKKNNLIKAFDFNGAYGYSNMLKAQIQGGNDSWAIRWYATAFLANKLTLYPGRSLVSNIGNDSSGTHCGSTSSHDVKLSNCPIKLTGIEVRHSDVGAVAFENFFRESKNNLITKVVGLFKRSLKKGLA